MTSKRPRISDVAALAGVSTATVSRAISNPGLVSEETRAAVEDAVRRTGYRINLAARNLRQRRTGGIVALVPNLANPFFSQILSGIAEVLGPAGYNLLIADTRAAGAETLLAYAEPSRADGMIAFDCTLPRAALEAAQLPLVQACEWVPGLAAPRVVIDNHGAAALAVAHLASLGHVRIGHVRGPAGNVLAEARLAGTADALELRGLVLPAERVYAGDFSLDAGRAAAVRWLEEPEATRPTAMFLASDAMACGFVGELHHRGLRVPDDLSVVGFDDIEIAAHIAPPLTTIRQPRDQIGRLAAERMLALIARAPGPADTVLPASLVPRASTAPPAGGRA